MDVFLDYTIELRGLSGVAADGFAAGFRCATTLDGKVGVAIALDRRTVYGRNWVAGFKAGHEYLADPAVSKCAR